MYFGPKGHHYTATLAKVEPGVFVLQAKLLSLPKTLYFNVVLTQMQTVEAVYFSLLKLHLDCVLHHKWDGSTVDYYRVHHLVTKIVGSAQ